MTIPVRDLLSATALGGARVIGGREGLDREVSWTSVIEWQAVRFVQPGELVLTTGIGLDEPTLTRFLGELLESDAAAVAISLSPDEPVAAPPAPAVKLADRLAVPLIDLPWRIGFADVSRWVVDELLRRRFAGSIDGPAGIHARFAAALLEGLGMNGIAAALEGALERPVLVFDAGLQLVGYGPLAEHTLGVPGLGALRSRAVSLSATEVGRLAAEFDGERPRHLAGLEALELGPGTGRVARARHDTLGFLYVLDGDDRPPELAHLALHAVEEAASSVAIEGLRRRSMANDRLREDFLWQLVAGLAGTPEHVRARAALLGLDVRAAYELAVARADGDRGRATLQSLARAIGAAGVRAATEVTLGVRDDIMVAIAAAPEGRLGALRRLVVDVQAGITPARRVSWGVAATARPVEGLAASYDEAQRALEVGRAVVGPASVGDATELAPYMMLAGLGADPEAMAIARSVVAPLLDYDRAKRRNLVETLDVYLQESGNASAAARRLFLNRRSLGYRLRRIEELTGRALDHPGDRFVLELSIKLLRFGIVDESPPQ